MHARVGAAALQEDAMTILLPGGGERGEHHRAAKAAAAEVGMGDDVFEKCMLGGRSAAGWAP
jgi:hypothetical protein